MPSEEDVNGEGFEILDHEEAPSGAQQEPDRKPAGQETPEAPEGTEAPPLEPLDTRHLLRVIVGQLAAAAWQKMGLQPDPFTNQVVKDIEQARLAIDTAAALIEKLLPHVQGQEAKDYQSLLTDLRLNFVKQSEDKAGDQ